jgi:DNA gyrase/topoisomerase IV subunit A
MKERFKIIAEINGNEEELYTYAIDEETARRNITYRLNERGDYMFRFKRVERESEEIMEEKEQEILKECKGYYISNQGKVFSIKNDSLYEIKQSKNGDKLSVSLSKDGNTTYNVDSLVWRAFVGGDDERIRLNHKDGNLLNNKLSNLEKANKKQEKIIKISQSELENNYFKKEDFEKLMNEYLKGKGLI